MIIYDDWSIKDIVGQIEQRRSGATLMVAIAGPPAAGKSTLAEDICRALNDCAGRQISQFCPMDGFFFSNAKLDRLGLRRFKGRIDTFDVESYVSCLSGIRRGKREFYWPIYSREKLHDVVTDGTWISAATTVFVTEGNYVLSTIGLWRELIELVDLKLYLEVAEDVMIQRLRRRYSMGELTRQEAEEKIVETDLPNAKCIATNRDLADIVLSRRRVGDFEYNRAAAKVS